MSAATGRPNFFILLELDPDAPWSQTDFEIRLKEKQNEWSRLANNPKPEVRNNANSNLQLGREIHRVMEDSNERAREGQEYRKAVEAAKAPMLRQFEADLTVLHDSGATVAQAELEELVKTYQSVLTKQEIQDRLAVKGITIRANPRDNEQDADRSEEKPFDPVVAQQIQDNLNFLNEASLYTLLSNAPGRSSTRSLDFNSPSSEMLEAATLLSEWTFKQINTGPEITAKRALAGQAQSIFKDKSKREKYDEMLRRQPLDQLLKQIERLCAPLKELNPQRAEQFLRKAVEHSVLLADATDALTKLIKSKGWPQILLSDPTDAVQRLHACANCHRLSDPADQFCKWCKEPLWLDCPNCDAKHLDAGVPNCGKCGFPLTRRPWVVWVLNETDRLVRLQDWTAAAEQLDEVRQEWAPKHPDDLVRRMDVLTQQLQPQIDEINREREEHRKREEEARQREQERLEAERKAREAALQAIAARVRERRLYEVRRLLAEAPRPTDEHPDYKTQLSGFQKTAEDGIKEAERLVAQARAAHERGDDDEAARLCYDALHGCADSSEAMILQGSLRVPPPRNLHVETVGHSEVRLKWDPPSSPQSDGYTVRRKVGSAPAAHDDGALVEMTGKDKTASEDTRAERGEPVYYAVFSRAGIRYSRPVTAATLLAPPITGLACEVTPHEVRLHWEAPSPHMRGVRVRRAEGAPPKTIEDGDAVSGAGPGSVADRDVRTGTRYGYAVFAEYAAVSGRAVWSAAASIHAVPQTPPQPITDLRVERRADLAAYAMAVLSCTPPESGELSIVVYAGDEPPRPGSVDRWDLLTSKRRVLAGHSLPVLHAWTGPGACWYVPVVRLDDMGYVGKPA
ncbi:MAG TPA: hypothetical protein VF116_04140, partial [Ktedonobacterales bacterium]